ncbi:hypothetical protein LTR59_009173 [Friedmanniomyces endolithicus]|nr:hypothetical protein LTR59_009173 [Friedmanniomyces endolithicus]KAK0966719.1 hypothetical protein LTS01_017627 [Friedmanniomyces endolithicus]
MRLLRLGDHGGLSLTKHDDDKLPPYAILSHTWGDEDDEVTFDDLKRDDCGRGKAGYDAKLLFCGRQARNDDLLDFWVDTCCIKKESDAELSEALNSMFRWYRQSAKCYVYLQDVSALKRDRDSEQPNWVATFRKSRWFTRGWTLQELIAPRVVEFWSRDGHFLGTKESLEDLIVEITGVPASALRGASLSNFTTNERLRWAAKRETKRPEDKAYCLLGLCDVFISPICGEGTHAFVRLQNAIGKAQGSLSRGLHSPRDGGDAGLPLRAEELVHQQRRRELLASLSFDQMDSRHATINDAQRTTCEWILTHPDYVTWNDRESPSLHKGMLWIVGKPGAGKPTLMKFAHSHAVKSRVEEETVLSFFFNARGNDLEKTTLGMYRSLLFQLLKGVPGLQIVLDAVDANTTTGTDSSQWMLNTLQNLLSIATRRLGQGQLRLFIDALDECDEQQIRDMVEFFGDLAEDDPENQSRISICFASRHYPTIDIGNGRRLVLEDDPGHAEDLGKYIQRRLRVGDRSSANAIHATLLEKANGVFMWVVLVVGLLNEEYRRGSVYAVQQRLAEIPSGLSDLFKDLLRRDRARMGDLLLCLQWILFAREPLTREEFYFAMMAGLYHGLDHRTKWTPRPWDSEEVTAADMERLVLSSSKGLAELTRSKTAPTVQFIHESVRDFLLKDNGIVDLWPELDGQLASSSHDTLKSCCSAYLAADLSSHLDPAKSLAETWSSDMEELQRLISRQFPFLDYAHREVLYHANEAAYGVDQQTFLGSFELDKWIPINNLYAMHDSYRHSPRATMLYVSARYNCSRLILAEAPNVDKVWSRLPEEFYQFPILAAFANGHRAALQGLLGDDGAAFVDNIARDIGPGSDELYRMRENKDVLLWTAYNGRWALAECLLTLCANKGIYMISSSSPDGDTLLSLASHGGCRGAKKVVQLLLQQGVDVNAQGGVYGNALQAACCDSSQSEVVQLLLNSGADVNAQGGRYGNALQAACCDSSQSEVVQLLLNSGADLLLDSGADVNAQGGLHSNALQAACSYSHDSEVVQLLLDSGADVNAQGGWHSNALQATCSYSHDSEVVQLLLDSGADVNAQGGQHNTALQAACCHNYKSAIVQLLLDSGADVNAQVGSSATLSMPLPPTDM